MGLCVPVAVVDHVEPHQGDQSKFWNSAMWQSACTWHHSVVKQKLEARFLKREITTADLWLNSPIALQLARELDGRGGQ